MRWVIGPLELDTGFGLDNIVEPGEMTVHTSRRTVRLDCDFRLAEGY